MGEFLWLGFFSVLFGTGAIVVSLAAFISTALYFWGIDLPGQIVSVQFEGAPASGRYRIDYQFRVGNKPVTGQTLINADRGASLPFELKMGAHVQVRVLSILPGMSSTLEPNKSTWGLLLFLLFAGCFDAFTSFLQYAFWHEILLQRLLVKYGQESHEKIGDIQIRTGSRMSKWLEITFSYPCGVATMTVPAYGLKAGDDCTDGTTCYAPAITHGMPVSYVKVGDPLTVLYKPDRASCAIIYDFSYFRCLNQLGLPPPRAQAEA
jgi:hypothetical protein